ncbi:MAG: P1 family peptidase [Spirochaetales bacterium]|uniref:P1 family peptidase n=1 Tax=Candidatus Thalassospirochaeta sargassi TaxID=3119039 RepID=A0AAJ1MJZ6_9SPIO|nr:P1 family peptidase [Spirochaetales bacterium]
MLNSICDVPGILVGHAQNTKGGTGCTVIIAEEMAACGVNVAGGGPGTRETDALNPVNLVHAVNAVYLGGGSAYGLAGADGVMQWCEDNGKGFDVGVGIVPIVPGAVLFDLPVADYKARPDAAMGYAACENASSTEARMGNVGAGTGATVGKSRGMQGIMKGGLGTASVKIGEVIIGAIVAVNCFGNVQDPETGETIAGVIPEDGGDFKPPTHYLRQAISTGINPLGGNTTIGAIATNAKLNKVQATKVSMMSHDGYARAINPIHTMHDGDTIFTLSTGEVEADVSSIGAIAAEVMAKAIAAGVSAAKTAYGFPGHAGE